MVNNNYYIVINKNKQHYPFYFKIYAYDTPRLCKRYIDENNEQYYLFNTYSEAKQFVDKYKNKIKIYKTEINNIFYKDIQNIIMNYLNYNYIIKYISICTCDIK
jgi:hypothetical protein